MTGLLAARTFGEGRAMGKATTVRRVKAARIAAAISAASVLAVMSLIGAPSGLAATTAATPDVWSSEYGGGGNAGTNAGEHVITAATAARLQQVWKITTPAGTSRAPAVVNGVVYHIYNIALGLPSRLDATSAKSGATLWSLPLSFDGPSESHSYEWGLSIVGNLALLPFTAASRPGGLTAVNIATHKIAWTASLPTETTDMAGWTSHPIVADSGRVYLYDAESRLYAYRVSDGKLLWQERSPVTYIGGTAAAGGLLYVSDSKYGGTYALNGATGAKLWSTPIGMDLPIVAGGYLIAVNGRYVAATKAAGCGHSVCPALWRRLIPDARSVAVGGADANVMFIAATIDQPVGQPTGVIQRLSTVTGKVQWSAALPPFPGRPVRIANTVWVIPHADTLIGFSTTATHATPLRSIKVTENSLQQIADANGTLVLFTWVTGLTGYRIPGT